MYNAHRGMVAAPNNRLTELLDQIRGEFESQAGRSGEYEHQLQAQMAEMDLVRQKVFQLEQQQIQIKNKYDEEVSMLRRELETRGGQAQQQHIGGAPHSAGSSQPPPPSIGHGPSNLFGGIMAGQGGQGGQGGPGLAPPPQQEQQQGHPQHQMPQPPASFHQSGPPPGPQQQFSGYQQPPVVNGLGGQPTQQPPSPRRPGNAGRVPPGLSTPQQQSQMPPYADQRASPIMTRPTPPPAQATQSAALIPDVQNRLGDLDFARLPQEWKKEGDDWFAVFNPRVTRILDVDLVHTLEHSSVVCCVRFSHDGAYVATGCNHSAQIYDVNTGARVAVLQDDTVDRDGDLYIRSVCFSPDGKYLATGAEDKLIRVWDIGSRTIKHTFSGHDQDIYSLDFAKNGRHIASGSGDRTVRVWDIEQGQQVLTLSIEDGVTTVAISPDGRLVAAGSLDKSVRVWDSVSGYLVERLEGGDGHKDSVYSVAFSPNGRELVSGSLDKTIKMWELSQQRPMISSGAPRGGKCIRTFEGHKDFVLSVALTPDARWVMSGSKDRGVQFWDPATGSTQLMLQGHKNSVISVAPSPTGNLFATGSGDMKARIWRYDRYTPRGN